jgi:hypothetical protein
MLDAGLQSICYAPFTAMVGCEIELSSLPKKNFFPPKEFTYVANIHLSVYFLQPGIDSALFLHLSLLVRCMVFLSNSVS